MKRSLLPSGNDGAIALAETVGAALQTSGQASGNSAVDAFVAQMNATAQGVHERCTRIRAVAISTSIRPAQPAADRPRSRCAAPCIIKRFRSVDWCGSTTITVTRSGAATDVFLQTTDGSSISTTIYRRKADSYRKGQRVFHGAVKVRMAKRLCHRAGLVFGSQRFFDVWAVRMGVRSQANVPAGGVSAQMNGV